MVLFYEEARFKLSLPIYQHLQDPDGQTLVNHRIFSRAVQGHTCPINAKPGMTKLHMNSSIMAAYHILSWKTVQ